MYGTNFKNTFPSRLVPFFYFRDGTGFTKSRPVPSRAQPYFISYNIVQIPREQNERADALARLASVINRNVGKHTPIEYLNKPSIEEEQETLQIDNIPNWMDHIFDFLSKGELPDDPP
ncbi:hypothetical protein ACLB2K_056841 [Fragaria x ananassa]